MRITTGRVRNGVVDLEGDCLPEGTLVTVLSSEGEEDFELTPEEVTELSARMEEADRGDTIDDSKLRELLRRR